MTTTEPISPQSLPWRNWLFRRLVLIYQMPKIGSQTIEASLLDAKFPAPVLRFHYLSNAFAKTLQNGLLTGPPDAAWRRDMQWQLDSLQVTSRALRRRRLLRRCGFPIPKLEVITGMRELIGLMLASIFENFIYFAPNVESMTVEKCCEALLDPKTFKTIRGWFDLEIKPFIGIDVFRKPFPYHQGHAVYENNFARLLVYRFESLQALPELLRQFLQWPIPSLVNRNVGDSKHYAQQYQSVKRQLRLPPEFVQSLLDEPMMQHFYSTEERQNFFSTWAQADHPR